MANMHLGQNTTTQAERFHSLSALIAAVVVSLFLVLIKSWAWFESGSNAVLSSVVDSFLDIIISATTLGALWYASKPADEDHRHGHGKAEGVAALFQAAFILGSSAFVMLQTFRSLTQDNTVSAHGLGVTVMVISIILNLSLVLYQRYVMKRTKSLAIEADQAHYLGDTLIHFGVIASLVLDAHFGWFWIDPVFTVVICAWLCLAARSIGMQAMNMLLDRELEEEERNAIIETIRRTEGFYCAHDLRTRRSGTQIKMALDIEVDPEMTLYAAHEVALNLEKNLLSLHPNSEIMIHIDPHGEPEDFRHKSVKNLRITPYSNPEYKAPEQDKGTKKKKQKK
jgi:ferrous-iron efflux pump FieF